MKRFILIVCVTTLVLFSGCTGVTPFNENQTPTELVGDKTDNVGDHADSQQSNTGNSLESVSGTLQIHHIDVGQADATFVRTPINETILIDSGDWRDDGEQVIAYLEQHGVTRIDHLIATHPHADHIGGHEAVIRHFEQELDGVGKIYDSGVTHTSQTYAEYLAAVNDTGNTIFVVDRGDTVPLQSPNVTATVLNPPSSGVDGKHKNSIALQITFGEFEYVTTGDAEQSTEQRLLTQVNETLVEGTVY